MATRELIINYAMYAIGEVESHWTWNSVTYYDGVSSIITIGMMQNAGTHAQRLLKIVHDKYPDEWAIIESGAPNLADNVINWPEDWNTWASRYLTQEEGETLSSILGNDNCKMAQQEYWSIIASQYIDSGLARGFSLDYPKQMIYYMCMYHQSPASANSVADSAGGSATLQKLHTTRANHYILGQYTNRYNTIYNRLSDWDGESNPPDFGQIGDYKPGDNHPPITEAPSKLGYIIQVGNDLYLYGKDEYKNGVVFVAAGGQRWVNGYNANGENIEGGNTGGGSSTDNAKTIDWARQYLGQWAYIYGGDRYNPAASGGTDCSGFTHAAYWIVRGIEIGGYTGAQYTSDAMNTIWEGSSWSDVPWSEMVAGDIVLMSRDTTDYTSGTGSHVALYTGTGSVCIDVGSTPCPTERDITFYNAIAICIRRVK